MTSDIILDSHAFNTDTSPLAQYEGGGVKSYHPGVAFIGTQAMKAL